MNIDWNDLLNALALVLIIEGIMPFASPGTVKQTYRKITELSEETLRMIGLGSMVVGLLVLFLR
ncbi:MAG: Unknown protein [uncultured Thiotrichaceae bacterium]|uniref:DUF2065 domain-containing protein n=1 Tax=uncultured Thiotrichaceae bacterium TaxID=298394 RepID=A0A6S6TEL8_9GAMM|nr:MAG: Unknown protein [uncultured Thiotrichaceae bacterium]